MTSHHDSHGTNVHEAPGATSLSARQLQILAGCCCLLLGCGSEGKASGAGGAAGAAGQTTGGASGAGGNATAGNAGVAASGGNSVGGDTSGGAGGAGAAGSAGSAGSGGMSTSGPVAGKEYGSGSRLKVVMERSESGAARAAMYYSSAVTFYDTLLEVECNFTTAEDGKLRCLPGHTGTQTEYADPSCASPALRTVIACSPATYLRDITDSCDRRVKVFKAGTTTNGPLYRSSGGVCTPIGLTADYYQAATKVAASEFVAADYSAIDYGNMFGGLDLVAEDGAWFRLAFYDFNGQYACVPGLAMDGQWRCLPVWLPTTAGGSFGDASCFTPAVSGTTDSGCSSPFQDARFSGETDDTTCPPRTRIRNLQAYGPEYVNEGGVCHTTTRTAYYVGAEVTPNAFRPLAQLAAPSGERVTPQIFEFDNGGVDRVVLSSGWMDTQLGVECYSGIAADGARRCIPQTQYLYSGTYAAPGCNAEPLFKSTTTCKPKFVGSLVGQFCPARYAVSPLLAAYSGTAYYGSTGSCSPTTNGGDLYKIGAELDPASLVALSRTH